MNLTQEKMEWQRDGSVVYTLMHDGWRKGEQQFRNRIWFGVYADKDAGVSREDAAAYIFKALSAHDKLVAALKEARTLLSLNGIDLLDISDYGSGPAHRIIERIHAALTAAEAA